ncbi:butyrophilin subfamily 1 member A1-like [Porphyrio hochstetteri]
MLSSDRSDPLETPGDSRARAQSPEQSLGPPAPFNVTGPPGPITVAVGEDVVLPCRFSPAQPVQDVEVTWFREHFSPFVHRYRGGQDQYGEQMLPYQGHTELLKDGLAEGSVDLKIFRVRISDRGNYTCFVRYHSDYDETVVELKVTASGSAPLIVLEHYQDGGIRVACRSHGWYPQPRVLWQDPDGRHLPSLWESGTQNESGLFAVESSIILTRAANQKLSCRVGHAQQHQGHGSAFYISDPFFQNAHPWMTALAVVLVAVAALLISVIYLFKMKGKQEKKIAMQEAALRHCDAQIGESSPDKGIFTEQKTFSFPGVEHHHQHHPLQSSRLGWERTLHCQELVATCPHACASSCGRGSVQIDIPQPTCPNLSSFSEKQAKELAWRRYAVPIEEEEVVLDPDTAHCDLILSDDCKSVKREDKRQDIPDIPERFDPWRCVLGREGFTSGRHYWEVEAVDGGGWTVGVSREDVKRKGEIEFKPEEGIWAVGQWAGRFQALTSPDRILLSEIRTPKRIRVSLDYEEGRVTFFSVDEEIPIFTFPLASFGGVRVHPWVWLGPGTWLKMWP